MVVEQLLMICKYTVSIYVQLLTLSHTHIDVLLLVSIGCVLCSLIMKVTVMKFKGERECHFLKSPSGMASLNQTILR